VFFTSAFSQIFDIVPIAHPNISSCSSDQIHSIEFQNISGTLATGVALSLELPDGALFDSVADGEFTVIGENGNSISFAAMQDVEVDEIISLSYILTANCVDATLVFTAYHVTCDQTINPDTEDQATANWNFLAPSLNIISISEASHQSLPGAIYSRTIQAHNAGNESLDEFSLDVAFDSESIIIIATDIGTLEGNTVTITSADLDGSFDPEEDVFIELTEEYSGCELVNVTYTATWSCDGETICQSTIGLASTSVFPGEPSLSVQAIDANDPRDCEVLGWNSFKVINMASEVVEGDSDAQNVKLTAGVGWPSGDIGGSKFSGEYFFVTAFELDGQLYPIDSTIIDPAISASKPMYQITLEELDAQDTLDVIVHWFYRYPNVGNPDCESLDDVVFHGKMNLQVDSENKCGQTKPEQFEEGIGSYFQYRFLDETIIAPSDADEGDVFTLGIYEDWRIEGSRCNDPVYVLHLAPPAGVDYIDGSQYGLRSDLDRDVIVSTLGDGTLVFEMDLPDNSSISAYGPMELGGKFILNCPADPDVGIAYEVFLKCNDCPDSTYMSKLACGITDKLNPNCNDCFGVQVSGDPEVFRTNYGYSDATMTELLTYEDVEVIGNLNLALTHDTVRMQLPAVIAGVNNVSAVQLEIGYHKLHAEDELLFTLLEGGEIHIYDESSSTQYELPIGEPTIVDTSGYVVMQFLLDDQLNGFPLTYVFEDGDSLWFQADFTITGNTLLEDKTEFAEIANFRFQLLADGEPCNSKGAEFFVAQPLYNWLGNNDIPDVVGCDPYEIGFSFKNLGRENESLFNQEFRPMFQAQSFELFIPEGWSYDEGSLYIEYFEMDQCLEADAASFTINSVPTITEEVSGSWYAWSNPGNWPVKGDGCIYYANQYNFKLTILPLCNAADGADIHMPANLVVTTDMYGGDATANLSMYTYEIFKPEDKWTEVEHNLSALVQDDGPVSGTGSWTVRITNESGEFNQTDIWIAIQNQENQLNSVEVISLADLGVLTINDYSNGFWLSIDTLPAGGFLDFGILADFNGCDLGEFNVISGKSCGLVFDDFGPNSYGCEPNEVTLSYNPQPAELQVGFTAVSTDVDLCEVANYEVVFNNALLGHVNNLELQIELPLGVDYVPEASWIQYPGPDEFTNTPGEIVLGTLGQPMVGGQILTWSIDELLPAEVQMNGLPGALQPDENALLINVALSPNCEFFLGSTLLFSASGSRACGAPLDSIFGAPLPMPLAEIDPSIQTIAVLNVEGVVGCDSMITVSGSVQIIDYWEAGSESGEDQDIWVVIPPEFSFISGSLFANDNGQPLVGVDPQEDIVENGVRLSWPMPIGVAADEFIEFGFGLTMDEALTSDFEAELITVEYVYYECGDDNCLIPIAQGATNLDIELVNCAEILHAVDDYFQISINETSVLSALDNDLGTGIDSSTFEIIEYPDYGVTFEMFAGQFEYTPNPGWSGTDTLVYLICNESAQCDTAVVYLIVFDENAECTNLFFDDEIDLTIENCESHASFCLPFLWEDAGQYEIYVDGLLETELEVCNFLEYSAYNLSWGAWNLCPPVDQFPLTVDSWEIQGIVYGPQTVTSWQDLEIWLNTVDPLGFWGYDGFGQMRGGMLILDYGPMVISSPCTATTEIFLWEQYIIPENPGIMLEPGDCYWVAIVNTAYENCSDSVYVCTDCLGIVNTAPYTVDENALPVDTLYGTTYSDMMIDYCFEFVDDEGHAVGIDYTIELNDLTSVFYDPGDNCIYYLPPPEYLGSDTVLVNYCDNGDPELCGQVVFIVEVLPLDGQNSLPYTLDQLALPEDTLMITILMNQFTEYCFDFADAEGDNVGLTDIIDLGTDASLTTFAEGGSCIQYSPALNYVGPDVILVNYCDDGDPVLCNFSWLVIDIVEELAPNNPPFAVDSLMNPVDTMYIWTFQNFPVTWCANIIDPDEDETALTNVLDYEFGNVMWMGGDYCVCYGPEMDYIGMDTAIVTFCDNGFPQLCDEIVLVIEVLELDCGLLPQLENSPLLTPYSCDSLTSYCVPVDFELLNYYELSANGEALAFSACGTGDFFEYDFSYLDGLGCLEEEFFPLNLNYWVVNGLNVNGFQVFSFLELASLMSMLDDDATWTWNGDRKIRTEVNWNIYEEMVIFNQCNLQFDEVENATVELPTNPKIDLLPAGCNTLIISDPNDEMCFTTWEVCVECLGNHPPYTVDGEGVAQEEFEIQLDYGLSTDYCFEIIDPNMDAIAVTNIEDTGSNSSIFWDGDESCFFYFPDDDFLGQDTIVISYCDDGVPVMCSETILVIEVYNINYPPVAEDDAVDIPMQGSSTIDVLDNDSDPDDDELTITSVSATLGGVALFDGQLFYYAPEDYCGPDTITYVICDWEPLCDTGIVLINVFPEDSDGDGIPDVIENVNFDTDGDGLPDYLDSDSDNDNIPDGIEGYTDSEFVDCMQAPTDTDGDGVPDYLDEDADDDGLLDSEELIDDCDGDLIPNWIDADEDCDEPLEPEEIIVPQGFSPNGDGIGDVFQIIGLDPTADIQVVIYNRWGHEIYAADPYNNDWNGRANVKGADNGKDLPVGVYYYTIDWNEGGKPTIGWVYLTR
jgi:gliding motility-associated-like protein